MPVSAVGCSTLDIAAARFFSTLGLAAALDAFLLLGLVPCCTTDLPMLEGNEGHLSALAGRLGPGEAGEVARAVADRMAAEQDVACRGQLAGALSTHSGLLGPRAALRREGQAPAWQELGGGELGGRGLAWPERLAWSAVRSGQARGCLPSSGRRLRRGQQD